MLWWQVSGPVLQVEVFDAAARSYTPVVAARN